MNNMSGKRGLDALFQSASMADFREAMDGREASLPIKRGLDPAVYAECFGTDAGQQVLQDMYNRFVNCSRCIPGLGSDEAFYREGMAQVVFDIVDQFDRAFNGEENGT